VYSAPIAIIVIVIAVKTFSVVIAGNNAQAAYSSRDKDALQTAVSILGAFNVIEPAKAPFAAGAEAVLDDRLTDADRQFSASIRQISTAESCPARVNLELVRETMGDRAAAAFEMAKAVDHYVKARVVVEQAPPDCFAGNQDRNVPRRAVRAEALARLNRKIDTVQVVPPPPPAASPPSTSSPPPGEPSDAGDDQVMRRLNPRSTPPLDRLQQILRDGAGQEWG
jgi:hypothetical protein